MSLFSPSRCPRRRDANSLGDTLEQFRRRRLEHPAEPALAAERGGAAVPDAWSGSPLPRARPQARMWPLDSAHLACSGGDQEPAGDLSRKGRVRVAAAFPDTEARVEL
jgi:hypothetical protein